MKHLIIGAGNMGKRHGAILQAFGDTVEYQDVGFDPSRFGYKGIDSALVCTPANTHALVLAQLPKHLPVFVEKPVFTEMSVPASAPFETSMVACNWRFCRCLKGDRIDIGYPAKLDYAYLDLIHFLDLYWERHGKPEESYLDGYTDTFLLTLIWPQVQKSVAFNYATTRPITYVDGVLIHEKPCDMFERQMETWRYALQGSMESPNPIAKAVERTNHLIGIDSPVRMI